MDNFEILTNSSGRLKGFPPLYSASARVLILGSMPSAASLAAGRYYAHRANRFWPVMAAVFPQKAAALLSPDFDERYAALTSLGIALWDTIGECEREGSLDSAIRSAVPNDLPAFLKRSPSVRLVILNGKKSLEVWRRAAQASVAAVAPELSTVCLPSTSPANAAVRLPELVDIWGKTIKSALSDTLG